MAEIVARLNLNGSQFRDGIKRAEADVSRFSQTAERASKTYSQGLSAFAGRFAGASERNFQLFSGLAQAIDNSGGSLKQFTQIAGGTVAITAGAVALTAAFKEYDNQVGSVNAKLAEMGYKGVGFIGMVRVAMGDLSSLEMDAVQRKANAINKALASVGNQDASTLRERVGEQYQRGRDQSELNDAAASIAKTITLERELERAIEQRKRAELAGSNPRTVAELDARVAELPSLKQGAERMSNDANIPFEMREEASRRALLYEIQLNQLLQSRPALVAAEASKQAAEAARQSAEAERQAADAARERLAAQRETATLQDQLGRLIDQNAFDALSADEQRAELAKRIADAEQAAAAYRLQGNEDAALRSQIEAERMRGRLQSMREISADVERPSAPERTTQSGFAQIGLFAGGAAASGVE
jgi:hypothetical protein